VGLYALYVILIAIFKPQWVPALPEARTLKEDNGDTGLPSLLVLTTLCTAASVYVGKNMAACTPGGSEAVEKVALDETIVVAMCFGVALAFIAASVNRITRMGLLSRMAERVTFVLIPPLLLIFLVLGTIFLGGHADRRRRDGCHGRHHGVPAPPPDFDLLKQALATTTKLSCFVVFILIGATMFGLTFQGVDGPKWVEHLLTGLPGGQLGFLIVVNIMIFFLAFFLDFFELSFIVVPLLAPWPRSWAST
jgi:TRAP-type mannitol/chloroaromatic compound transport system permease large subunit